LLDWYLMEEVVFLVLTLLGASARVEDLEIPEVLAHLAAVAVVGLPVVLQRAVEVVMVAEVAVLLAVLVAQPEVGLRVLVVHRLYRFHTLGLKT
jgi:hypothetical protein